MIELTETEVKRYSRQMILPQWGEVGQKKLKASKVFIAGAGGLGSPVAVNLALAGVGTIRICDFDSPEITNLNRQFLHDDSRIGINKAESAKMTLTKLNPHVRIEPVTEKIVEENVDRLVGDSNLIVDCMDNFPTRFALNACAVRKRIPLVHGAIWGFEARITFIEPPYTGCLACFHKESPPKEVFPVLGATPGIAGNMQAMEAIKYLTGVGDLLRGRYLCCDFSQMTFLEFTLKKDPCCAICSG